MGALSLDFSGGSNLTIQEMITEDVEEARAVQRMQRLMQARSGGLILCQKSCRSIRTLIHVLHQMASCSRLLGSIHVVFLLKLNDWCSLFPSQPKDAWLAFRMHTLQGSSLSHSLPQ